MKTSASFLLAALVVVGFAIVAPAHADQASGTLDVYWIDSEGGGSTLIVTPAEESILIDTGNPGGRDAGRIVTAAKAAGLNRIDYVLLTHFHRDHFGGAAEVAQQIPFGTIYERAIPDGDPDGRTASTFPLQIKPYREIAANRQRLSPGVTIPLKTLKGTPELSLLCMAADQRFIEPTAEQQKLKNPLAGTFPEKSKDTSDNANSAAFLLSFGKFRFMNNGDLSWNLEEKLVSPYNLAGIVDVYQTSHHGLAVSNHPIVLQTVEPTVVVMNNGPFKGGEAGAFSAIRSAKSVQALYQVHQSHNVPAELNAPAEFIANRNDFRGADAANCRAVVIKMSVAADGRSYTLSVPSSGHSKTYQTKG